MTNEELPPQEYDLELSFSPRLAAEHLGERKYTTPARAIAELVANSFDANAKTVEIKIEKDDLGVESRIRIEDDGRGIAPDILKTRFSLIGVQPIEVADGGVRLGKFGVGRLAVHRLGATSHWTTTAQTNSGQRVQSTFSLFADRPTKARVVQRLATGQPLGTHIDIAELRPGIGAALTPSRLAEDLLAQFCGYLLANPSRAIFVQGARLDVEKLVDHRQEDRFSLPNISTDVIVTHLLLVRPVDPARFPHQIVLTAKGRTVQSLQAPESLFPTYLALVDSAYLDRIISANREAIIDFDPDFGAFAEAVIGRVVEYQRKLAAERQSRFIENARAQEFYPFRNPPASSVTAAEQAVYDVVLEKVNEYANVEGMSKKQQAVVFRLLRRAVDNEDLLSVLTEVANLTDQDAAKFRDLLERTTLNSIIRLASEVSERLLFLDVLHELVYGDVAKHLKERSQLHKVLEPKCWLFGPRYHLATSDQSFREVVRKHRQLAKLPPAGDNAVKIVKGVRDIPDLFLAATKQYPADPSHNHLIVEIKAPSVTIKRKEVEQIRRYAQTIHDSAEFDKRSVAWDIYVVSSKVGDEIALDRQQENKPFGCIYDFPAMRLWAFSWAEIITAARDELILVRDHLERKSKELSVSEYVRKEYPEIGIAGLQEAS